MIEFCLFISPRKLGLVCFYNEQLEPIDWDYALKETQFNNCRNTERILNFRSLSLLYFI